MVPRRGAFARRFATAVALALALPATAAGQEVRPDVLLGLDSREGRVSATALAPEGAAATLYELAGGARVPVGAVVSRPRATDGLPVAAFGNVAPWRCDRLERRFEVEVAPAAGGVLRSAADVRTPDCADRFDVSVPARVRRGASIVVKVVDRWGAGGVTPQVCGRPGAAGRARCVDVALAPGATTGRARFAAGRDAVWRLRVTAERFSVRRVVAVGAARRPRDPALPKLLFAGDSLVQGTDALLADRLASSYRVASASRPGSGLTPREGGVDWPALATRLLARERPDVVVLSLGSGDGFPIRKDGAETRCCGEDWTRLYARSYGRFLDLLSREGRSKVVVMATALPRSPSFAVLTRAVNAAIRRAAATRPFARVVAVDELLTPGGAYRETGLVDGREQRLRADDGIHFSIAGSKLVARALADAVLGRGEAVSARVHPRGRRS